MQSIVTIIYSGETGQHDLAFGRIANFLGIDSVFLSIDEYIAQISSLKNSEKPGNILALGCNTLASIYEDTDNSERTITTLKNSAAFLFVYGISPGNADASALINITSGTVKGIVSYTDAEGKYEVSSDNMDITKQFSGLSFGRVNKETDFGLEVSDSVDGITKLINIDGKSLFVQINDGSCPIFLHATNQILDIDQPAKGVVDTDSYFSRLIPPMMFLKHVFKDRCWHNESEHASLTIDDPLLKKTYGFVKYDSLLDQMDHHNFYTNIAFIPWNYQRTDENIASMFKARDDRFAIGVHGCEHTGCEFGTTNHREIDRIAKLSLRRMKSHEERYGIPFDEVMTFPQGVFSTESMMVLKSNNYLAAINSGFIPTGQEVDIKISDILEPAIMNYYAFPLYYRRYPGEIASFAFDLFLGKPALIVTHHHDYKNMETITSQVDMLNELSDKLKWTRLREIIKSSYLIKHLDEDEFQVRLYSPCVNVHNSSERTAIYHIFKKESPEIKITKVNINGRETPYELNDNDLCIRVEIHPKSSINIEISYAEFYSDDGTTPGALKKTKVIARRIASEIRDNYVDKHPILAAIYKKLRKPT